LGEEEEEEEQELFGSRDPRGVDFWGSVRKALGVWIRLGGV
jgi:hypothetical protein